MSGLMLAHRSWQTHVSLYRILCRAMHSASLTECSFSLISREIVAEVGSGSLCAHITKLRQGLVAQYFMFRHINAIFSVAIFPPSIEGGPVFLPKEPPLTPLTSHLLPPLGPGGRGLCPLPL